MTARRTCDVVEPAALGAASPCKQSRNMAEAEIPPAGGGSNRIKQLLRSGGAGYAAVVESGKYGSIERTGFDRTFSRERCIVVSAIRITVRIPGTYAYNVDGRRGLCQFVE